MGKVLALVPIFLILVVLLPDGCLCYPLCTDSRSPITLNTTALSFCPYNGSSCCNSTQDLSLQKQFRAMNVSDPGCAALVKSILCARCDPFSAELFTISSTLRSVPVLCNSTVSEDSSQSFQGASDFCSKVWDTCESVSSLKSPFAASLQGQAGLPANSSSSKLTDIWQSKTDFCNAFGGASTPESVCFDGAPVLLNSSEPPSTPPRGLCLEKIGNGSYLNMVAHPDKSGRAFFSDQEGKIWLATIPDQGSGKTLGIGTSPFVDLTDEVYFNTEFGMMGMAFHPNFVQNGRFFASFNCDKAKWPGCCYEYDPMHLFTISIYHVQPFSFLYEPY